MSRNHTFHIPVMGLSYTIDTPIFVAPFGINSVVSIGDDHLVEKIRKYHALKNNVEYSEILTSEKDYRARRITAYLNLVNDIVNREFDKLKKAQSIFDPYVAKAIELLPTKNSLRQAFICLRENVSKGAISDNSTELKTLINQLQCGSIDVNIMVKTDKPRNFQGEKLPDEYNDAHSCLRGFAMSNLNSSVVLSAGMNPRLFNYMDKFEDFYHDKNGVAKKRIVIKVSDYRSALIQGKSLASKGLWVSEFRIESGLNCGGHAFATNGLLLGHVLQEFKLRREELIQELKETFIAALKRQDKSPICELPPVQITAQGGVGTSDEHDFLLNEYDLVSVGWGTPFLLVPEVCKVDPNTRSILKKAQEKDLYLSNTSPLGIPFNSVRGNTKDIEKDKNIEKGRPGSACPKDFLSFDTEFDAEGLCTASRKYQHLKLKQLEQQDLAPADFERKKTVITDKTCICVGLGVSTLIEYDIDHKREGEAVAICPGPNMAYFNRDLTLVEMVDHIYGRINVLATGMRPHFFVKEAKMYLDVFKQKMDDLVLEYSNKEFKTLSSFKDNLKNSLGYYTTLFSEKTFSGFDQKKLVNEFNELLNKVDSYVFPQVEV
jgi:hypothetical protein